MKNYSKLIGSIGLLTGIVIILFLSFKPFDNQKIGYIHTREVFEQFTYKKELEAKLKLTTELRKSQLDSLEFEIRLLAKKIEEEKGVNKDEILLFNAKREDYLKKDQQFTEDNAALASSYDQQIFNQLNQYVNDYGKLHNYKYILGNDGSGNIMYARDADNITNEVIKFINKKYKGE